MAKLDPRRLMEQAVEVMRQSVAERRADGKEESPIGSLAPEGTLLQLPTPDCEA